MERTVLAQDIREILEQSRKILDINKKLIDFMSKSPDIISVDKGFDPTNLQNIQEEF